MTMRAVLRLSSSFIRPDVTATPLLRPSSFLHCRAWPKLLLLLLHHLPSVLEWAEEKRPSVLLRSDPIKLHCTCDPDRSIGSFRIPMQHFHFLAHTDLAGETKRRRSWEKLTDATSPRRSLSLSLSLFSLSARYSLSSPCFQCRLPHLFLQVYPSPPLLSLCYA